MEGIKISLGGSVDQGPLNQTLEYQQVMLARERDRAKMELGGKDGVLREEEPPYIVGEGICPLPTPYARDRALLPLLTQKGQAKTGAEMLVPLGAVVTSGSTVLRAVLPPCTTVKRAHKKVFALLTVV